MNAVGFAHGWRRWSTFCAFPTLPADSCDLIRVTRARASQSAVADETWNWISSRLSIFGEVFRTSLRTTNQRASTSAVARFDATFQLVGTGQLAFAEDTRDLADFASWRASILPSVSESEHLIRMVASH